MLRGDPLRPVLGVSHDSRGVRPGDLFVAVPGATYDARRFVPDAVARGAIGVVLEDPEGIEPADAALIRVPSARAALADIAAVLQGHPSRALELMGVTGTDGKTTTTHLLAAALTASGRRTGRLSTVGVDTGVRATPNRTGFTTPEADEVQALLADMVRARCTAAVMEVSSHALELDRVRGCMFDTAVFTNLSPEHLDFHGSMTAYRAAKARLFALAPRAVLNDDDPAADEIRKHCTGDVVTYGLTARADVSARDLRMGAGGTTFTIVTTDGEARITTPLPGAMNVSNWLAAAAAALGAGATLADIRTAAKATTVEGRMQRIDCGQPFTVLVDFAHTPHALATALGAARRQTSGRVFVVFGHAGGRDASNRPALGAVAASLADVTVLTSDNPAHEDPAAVAARIAAGAGNLADLRIELDRAAALRMVLAEAEPGDLVLLAGKGHETTQVLAGGAVPWSEADEARRALTELGWSAHERARGAVA
jgi:UDP-N-acetylmuramoyl-L-alanyl-D-glutamate--2,6-diaminopimelate ligase